MNLREWKLSLPGQGSRTVRLEIAGYEGVFDRRFADQQLLPEFVRGLDALMQQGQVLKDDGASFVSRVGWNGHDTVIKRYNHRSLWHSLRHTIKGSRARRNWLSARYLLALKITTPEPLGYVSQYRGLLLWQSYFVTRFVPGPRVDKILRDETIVPAQKQRVSDLVLELLRRMAEHGVSHGDMKHTNILYDGTDVVLTDLDAMRIGGAGWLQRHRYRRDLARYLRDLHL
jgi:tRNA A-37 threonylcarbamoyl transferase component Bud32